ncbi:MAG TPA: zinc ribbon domain-containing protein [Gemmatales bacterium]|nr:zinc ribbon domain-containing protein [Gemmatales bacterium]
MPLYEFDCEHCGQVFEALVFPGEDAEQVACPKCQEGHVRRRLSTPAPPRTVSMPSAAACASDLPPCNPHCCRLPS